ncbi:MAG: barstar family protein [Terriglobia bacterium]|nr:barstar family protein [Terriglobia bacterium]
MRVIKLDATRWTSWSDYYDAILSALEAPHWHGHNANALFDSMVGGGINGVEPPYKIWIIGTAGLAADTMREIGYMVSSVSSQQAEKEPEITFQIDP